MDHGFELKTLLVVFCSPEGVLHGSCSTPWNVIVPSEEPNDNDDEAGEVGYVVNGCRDWGIGGERTPFPNESSDVAKGFPNAVVETLSTGVGEDHIEPPLPPKDI